MTERAPARVPSLLQTGRRSLGEAVRNPEIRSIETAWTLWAGGQWGLILVGLLIAYDLAGAWGVGLFGIARTLPATLVTMAVDTAGTGRPERMLVIINAVAAILAVVAVGAIALGGLVIALAAISAAAAVGALVRPTQFGLLPALAVTPGQLVSANVVASLGEAAGTLVGPLVAGFVTAALGPAAAAAIAALAIVGAAWFSSRVRVTESARVAPIERTPGVPVVLGLRTIAAKPSIAVLIGSFGLQVVVRGALTTLIVLLALEVLRAGESGVGVLNGALGAGGIVGAVGALWLVRRRTLAPVFAVALAGWGLPIAVAGALPHVAIAVVAMLAVGLSNALLDVAGFTLLQRGTPNRARAATFAVIEAMAGVAASLGAVLAPLLVDGAGVEGALIAAGLILPVAALAGWPVLRRLDREGVIPEEHAELLRRIPPFALLPLAGLERLAAGMVPTRFDPGDRLMTEGEAGDRYFVIASGSVVVTAGDRELRRQGRGEGCGDIALLRSMPRTATVTALEPVVAYAIDPATFLAAVSGHPGSAAAAEEIVADRLRTSSAATADAQAAEAEASS